MKATRFLTLMIAAATLMLTACNPEPIAHLTDGVTVTTAEPTFVSGTTASCGA